MTERTNSNTLFTEQEREREREKEGWLTSQQKVNAALFVLKFLCLGVLALLWQNCCCGAIRWTNLV